MLASLLVSAEPVTQFTSYYAFCAVVVLYVYTIQQQSVSRTQARQKYLSKAVQCQTQLSTIAEEGSLTERYCLVLEELRKETVRSSRSQQEATNPEASTTYSSQVRELAQQETNAAGTIVVTVQHANDTENMADTTDFTANPGSPDYGISGWGEFDYMVSLISSLLYPLLVIPCH